MKPEYKYKAYVEIVLDGDTCDCLIDLGFKTHRRERIRFYGIDCPESRSSDPQEKEKGLAAKEYVKRAIEGKWVMIETAKQGKFGRYLGKIYIEDRCLNDELIEKGIGRPYFGGKR